MSEASQDALFGQQLLRCGLITQAQLDRALEMQAGIGGKIGKVLLKMGFIQESHLSQQLAKHLGVDLHTSLNIDVPASLIEKIPSRVMREKKFVPVSLNNNVLVLAMADPCDFETIEEVRFETGCTVKAVLASETELDEVLLRFNDEDESLRREVGDLEDIPAPEVEEPPLELEHSSAPLPLETLMRQPPRIKVDALIELLLRKGVITQDDLEAALREQARKQ